MKNEKKLILKYLVKIETPKTHLVNIKIIGEKLSSDSHLDFFLPSWSPGSYLMREYGRNVQSFQANRSCGQELYFEQISKGTWRVKWEKLDKDNSFEISYNVFCHDLTVRTSHIDVTHAFLHGPSIFMGVLNKQIDNPIVKVDFPGSWSKVSTGLVDISEDRNNFEYQAENYDSLLDCPMEIGCHFTDGFVAGGKNHYLAFYGEQLPHSNNIREDIKIIVEHISSLMEGMPYEDYTFISHFLPNKFGGLEHSNSTVLQYDNRSFSSRKDYIRWLALVSHEYFHTWNIKRIRPKGLGPFNYLKEAETSLLWLAEGLTSFMDELFIYRCGLITLEEYLDLQKDNLLRYYSIKGRRFHSLENSSFNAWNKLYRPDENSTNSSISYYLKGGIAFFILHTLFIKNEKNINDLLHELWQSYLKNPKEGLETEDILNMIERIGNTSIRDKFDLMISTTEELDIIDSFNSIGLELDFQAEEGSYLGIKHKLSGDRVYIHSVELDGPAYKSGLNAGDEIIAINGNRVLADDMTKVDKYLLPNKYYDFAIFRIGKLTNVEVLVEPKPSTLKVIKVLDQDLAEKALK
jgi:predicted metalloprotease with PDZ domain